MTFFGSLGEKPASIGRGLTALDAVTKSDIPEGEMETGKAAAYYNAILSGDPAAVAAAIAPQTNAAANQTQAAKRQISSEGTARGGGLNAQLQASADVPTKTAVDTITALQPQAASAVTGIGASQTATGVGAAGTETSQGLAERAQDLAAVFDTLNTVKPGGQQQPIPSAPNPVTPGQGAYQVPEADVPIPSTITDADYLGAVGGD